MKNPIYETSTGALEALLETSSFVCADCYTYTFTSGDVLRFTAADIPITYLGHTFSIYPVHDSGKGDKGHWTTGLDIGTWSYYVYPRQVDEVTGAAQPDTLFGTPWAQAAHLGFFDGCIVQVDRAYAPTWPTAAATWGQFVPTGVLTIFAGRVADLDIMDTGINIVLNDFRELFDLTLPYHAFELSCRFQLYGPGCSLNAASFAVNSTIASGSTRTAIYSTATPGTGLTFTNGRMVFTSGANTRFSRSIVSWNSGTNLFTPLTPLPFVPAVGDTITVYPGCDRSYAACQAFNNTANFGGFLHVPPPELGV